MHEKALSSESVPPPDDTVQRLPLYIAAGDLLGQPVGRRGKALFAGQFALPSSKDSPTQAGKLCFNLSVPLNVPRELGAPELLIRLWEGCDFATGVPMPEAAMDEDHCTMLGKDEVGLSGEADAPKSIPEAAGVESAAQRQLRLGVTASYSGHALGAARGRKEINHTASVPASGDVAKVDGAVWAELLVADARSRFVRHSPDLG
jgi:hypothetical protein